MSGEEREGWDEAHAAICGRGNRTCSAHRPGCWGHLLVDALARIFELEAQVAGLEAMNSEKAAEIRRLRMGNHPAGRALRVADEAAWRALREALTERDAEHEGGAGA